MMVIARNSMLWPVLGALAGCALLALVAWTFASGDLDKAGDWNHGAANFIGLAGAIGLVGGWFVTARLTRGRTFSRTGLTLGYQRIEPTASGYRAPTTLTVDDLLARLRERGYQPMAKACDELGTVRGELEGRTPLAGANFAVTDAGVNGWIRVQLAAPPEGTTRAMGLIESWTGKGESATELGLFTLRALDGMLGELTASYDDSMLTGTPAKLFGAALPDRPQHRR